MRQRGERLRRWLRRIVAVLIGLYLLGPDLSVHLAPFASRLDLRSFSVRLYEVDLSAGRVLGFGVEETTAAEQMVAFGTALLALATGWLAWQTKTISEEEHRRRRAEEMRDWALEIREQSLQAGGLATLYLGRLTGVRKGEAESGDELHKRRWDALFDFVDKAQHRLAHLMRLHEDVIPMRVRVSFLTKMTTLQMHPLDEAEFAAAMTAYRNELPTLFALIDPLIPDRKPS